MSAPGADGLDGVAAILVNYNSGPMTVACARLLAAAGLAPGGVVVVDNASPDGSAEVVARHLSAARHIRSDVNLGFGAGCNRGVAAALAGGAEAVLLVNPDTLFGPELLRALVPRDDLAGACVAPEIFHVRAPGGPWFAGLWRGPHGTLRPRPVGHPRTDVDVIWACCMLVGRDVWARVGPFDEDYFLYYEDMDWCARARAAGVRLVVRPAARVWHVEGASSGGAASPLRRYHLTRGGVLYHVRRGHMRGAAGAVRLFAETRIALGLAARGDGPGLRAHLRGLADGVALARSSTSSATR